MVLGLDNTGKKLSHTLLSKHISEVNVLYIKYSPIDDRKLVSCGKENIRFWRLKKEHLSGCPVVLNQYARQSQFTTLDFAFSEESNKINIMRRVVVGSNDGMIFIINYDTRLLESVFKVHDLAICSMIIRAGFCVTGSADEYIRVWPLDFHEFHIEAKHDGAVISLDVSPDGLKVSVGTANGYLGVLDLANQNCMTVIRAHFGEIHALTQHTESQTLVSLGKDNSIRVWNTANLQQNYEFTYSAQDECTGIAMMDRNHFVGGFQSGAIRVFEINSVAVIEERNYLHHRVENIVVSPNGKFLVAGDEKAIYAIVSIERGYDLVRYLYGDTASSIETKICATISPDSGRLALIGKNSKSIDLYETEGFDRIASFSIANNYVHSINFNQLNANELIMLSCSGAVKIYSTTRPDSVKVKYEILPSHGLYTSSVACLAKGVYATAGEDACVRVWITQPQTSFLQCVQVLMGHNNGIFDLAVDGEQYRLFSTGGSEGIFVWDIFNAVELSSNMNKSETEERPALMESGYDSAEDLGWDAKPVGGFVNDKNLYEKARKFLEYRPVNTMMNAEGVLESKTEPQFNISYAKEAYPSKIEGSLEIKEKPKIEFTSKLCTKDSEQTNRSEEKTPREEVSRDFIEYVLEPPLIKLEHKPHIGEFPDYFKQKHELAFVNYPIDGEQKVDIAFSKLNAQKNLNLKHITSMNSDSSHNLIWYRQRDQLIYFTENKIVIEAMDEGRCQKIIHISELVSCITLAVRRNTLLVGTCSPDSEGFTPVYLIDLDGYNMQRHKVHKKGVQQIVVSPEEDYIMTIGSHKDKVVSVYRFRELLRVHEFISLDPVNYAGMAYNQFMKMFVCYEVSKDSLVLVTFNENKKGVIQEARIPLNPDGNSEVVLTCVDMKKSSQLEYIVALGTNLGDLLLYKLNLNYEVTAESFSLLLQARVSQGEVSSLKFSAKGSKLIIGTSTGWIASYQYNLTTMKDFDTRIDLKTFEFGSGVRSTELDSFSDEGLVSLNSGIIKYVDFEAKTSTDFTYGPSSKSHITSIKPLALANAPGLLYTTHHTGELNIWNAATLAHIYQLNLDFDVQIANFEESSGQLWLFGTQNELAFFSPSTDFLNVSYFGQPLGMPERYLDNYFVSMCPIGRKDRSFYALFTLLGDCYITDLAAVDDRLRLYKVDLEDLRGKVLSCCCTESGYLAVATNKNKVLTYKCDFEDIESVDAVGFELSSVFSLETNNRFDANWVVMEPSRDPANKDLVYCIGNYVDHLLVYNCATKDVS